MFKLETKKKLKKNLHQIVKVIKEKRKSGKEKNSCTRIKNGNELI